MWTRIILAILAALSGFLRSLWRAARQLFHETAGAFFVLFAVMGASSAWHEWRRGSEEWLIALAVLFTLVMAGFAVASFRSAHRVR